MFLNLRTRSCLNHFYALALCLSALSVIPSFTFWSLPQQPLGTFNSNLIYCGVILTYRLCSNIVLVRWFFTELCFLNLKFRNSHSDHYLNNRCTHSTQIQCMDDRCVAEIYRLSSNLVSGRWFLTELCPWTFKRMRKKWPFFTSHSF